jgi:signal transduction histidine kinase
VPIVRIVRHQLRGISAQDALLAAGVAAVAFVGTFQGTEHEDAPRAADALAATLAASAGLSLIARRRFPIGTQVVVTALVAVYLLRGYPFGPILGVLLLAIFSAASVAEPRRSLSATGVSLVACVLAALPRPGFEWLFVAWFAAPWAIGAFLRSRADARAAAAEQTARRRAYEERLRMAQEVHDVVGHGLSVIAMQAGVALHVLDRRPDDVRASLEAIRETSTRSLDGLRSTLALLREDQQEAERSPLPSLTELERLVEGVRATGVDVDLAVTGAQRRLPDAVDHAAYRIVQESLTNALRHSGATRVSVGVAYDDGAVELDVTDDGRGPAEPQRDGDGIAGMRERARALAGTLDVGTGPGGGFFVRARLPLERGT